MTTFRGGRDGSKGSKNERLPATGLLASPREELQGPLRVKPEYYNIKLAAAAADADFQSVESFFSSSVAEMSTKVNTSCFFFFIVENWRENEFSSVENVSPSEFKKQGHGANTENYINHYEKRVTKGELKYPASPPKKSK